MTPAQIALSHATELDNVVAEMFWGPGEHPLIGDTVLVDGGADHVVYTVIALAVGFHMPATRDRKDFMDSAGRVLRPEYQVDYDAVKIEGAGRTRIVGADRLEPFSGDPADVMRGDS